MKSLRRFLRRQPVVLHEPADEPEDEDESEDEPVVLDPFNQNECGICLEELYPTINSHELTSFNCGHIFHIICIINFIESNASTVITEQKTELDTELYKKLICPACRAPIEYDILIKIDETIKKYIRKLEAQKKYLEKKKYNKQNEKEYVDKITEVVDKHTEAVSEYTNYAATLEKYRSYATGLGEYSFCKDYVFEHFVYYNICAICKTRLNDPNDIFTNDCGHQFHKNCLTYKELGISDDLAPNDPTDPNKLICPVPRCGRAFNLDILKSVDMREKQKIFELDVAHQLATKTLINFKETVNSTARNHIIKTKEDAYRAYQLADTRNGDYIETIKHKYKDYMSKDLKYYFQTVFPYDALSMANAELSLAAGPKSKVTHKHKHKHKSTRKKSFNNFIKRIKKSFRKQGPPRRAYRFKG